MLSCLFCKRKKKLFKIYVIYGETACPIKDYILEFFGPVEKYLNEDQGICKTCVFVLNNLLYIKNFMYQALVTTAEDAYRIQPEFAFACMYKLFRHNLKKVDYEKSKSGQSSPDLFTYTKSLNNELVESNVQNDDYEVQSNNSLLREGTPYADREVQRVLSKRKKRTSSERRVKTALSRSNSLASFHSEPAYKKHWSTDFLGFGISGISEDERGMSKLRFNKDGILLNKKTRSVSRIISKSDAAYAVYTERIYKCVDGCTEEFDDLTSLTEHKIEDHKMLAKYWCYECYMTKFTSQEDLDKHNNLMHRTLITNCPLCSEEMQNQEELQRHLAEHRIHSVPCNYCDKFFLSGQSCESHILEYHKGRKKRIKRRRPQTILDRIDKETTNENKTAEEHGVKDTETFVKVLIQSVPEEGKQVAETVNADMNTVNNMDEDSSSCNCDENSTKQQESSMLFEVAKDVPVAEDNNADSTCTLEERCSENSSSMCDIEEEICVTALEETFVASVHEISVTYTENEMCSTQEEENEDVYPDSYSNSNEQTETREFPVEEEQVQSYADYASHISHICHEEIVTDNGEYLEVTSGNHFENVNQNKTNLLSAEDDETNHQNRRRSIEIHEAEVVIGNYDSQEMTERKINSLNIHSHAIDDESRGTLSLKKYPEKNYDFSDTEKYEQKFSQVDTDQNKTNSQLNLADKSRGASFTSERTPKKFRKKQETRRKSLEKETKTEATPTRPQLKIVLERLKIGDDFLQNLLVKSPNINNATPSTSFVNKQNIIKSIKKKKIKKVTASVKTPVHYRKLTRSTGKVYREKKQQGLSSKSKDNSLKDKLEIYDFKEDDDKLKKNSPQRKRNLKAKVFHKGKSKSNMHFKDGETQALTVSREEDEFPSVSVKTNVVGSVSDDTFEKYRTSTKVKRDRLANSLLKGKSKKKKV